MGYRVKTLRTELLFNSKIACNFGASNAMNHFGEIISLVVAASWTVTALYADKASRRLGSMTANVVRLLLAALFLAALLWLAVGRPYPLYADGKTWLWLALSALVGYLFGDWCLFNCYLSIGARFGQLFMTLAPPMAAWAGWLILGETLSWKSLIAMAVTLSGIAISILSRGADGPVRLALPLKGVLLGLGAGFGQGVGLVLSKVGMLHYAQALPSDAPVLMEEMVPFASTLIRALVGGAGFLLWMGLQKELPKLRAALRDRTGMRYMLIMTLTGPAVGVSLSLMAVQYADAGIASTLMALTPVLILIPCAFVYKQKIKAKEVVGVLVSMLGVALFFLL